MNSAFRVTPTELAFAVPAGVVLGAVIALTATLASARTSFRAQAEAALQTQRTAIIGRRWDILAAIYRDMNLTITKDLHILRTLGERAEVEALHEKCRLYMADALLFADSGVRAGLANVELGLQSLMPNAGDRESEAFKTHYNNTVEAYQALAAALTVHLNRLAYPEFDEPAPARIRFLQRRKWQKLKKHRRQALHFGD